MSTHTPGPWILERCICSDGTDCGIEVTPKSADEFAYRGIVCRLIDAEHIDGITKAERDANARLIAAAPMLLEALEAACMALEMHASNGTAYASQTDRAIIGAHDAIAAAKGEA